ncbi:hypothetical protein ACLX1H_010309 [Fusarium chlamydosporum]
MEQVDVTVIGGGPTGLFVALLLQRLNISALVLGQLQSVWPCIDEDLMHLIDEKPSTLELGRADALNARTQQYFEVAGILHELLPQGLKCNTSSTFKDGGFKSRQNAWWVGIEHALHKNFLMIGQPVVEHVMRSYLVDDVNHSERVTNIIEEHEFVEVETSSGRRVRSKYVVGADGARSFTRSALGISFSGTKPEMTWAVLDAFLSTDFPLCPEIITFELNGESRVAWIPRERGMSRFYVLLKGEITQELAEESIRNHLAPYRVDFTGTEWFSTFTGMGVNYGGFATPLVQGMAQGIWKPGYRCPDVILINSSGEPKRLYAMVSYGHFIVLSIGKWNVTDLVSVPVYNILPHETASQVGQHDSGGFSADWAKAEDSL